jgi:signal transduction histidine kinase
MLEDDFLKLRYKDNGKGFDIGTETASKGMGLSNIASRIGSLNGTLNITSNNGKGMQATVQIDTQPGKHIDKQEERRWRKRRR